MSSVEPIDDEEILYRRIPVSTGWYDPIAGLSPQAFAPTHRDKHGISVARARFTTIEGAATSPSQPQKQYYVAVLQPVKNLRLKGMTVVPDPNDDVGAAHSLISSLTYESRNSDQSREQMVLLATKLTSEVKGPFPPNPAV
jgi:hypothetical protein